MHWNLLITFTPRKIPLVTVLVLLMVGCNGGDLRFEQTTTDTQVAENTSGVFWSAKAIADNNAQPINYSLGGSDGDLFSIDTTTGALSFKTPADFELPLNSNRDNKYHLDIVAYQGLQKATQDLTVQVTDLHKPVVTLVSPLPFANAGKGISTDIDVTLNVWDEESNMALKNARVSIDDVSLIQDAKNNLHWTGTLTLPTPGGKFTAKIIENEKTVYSHSFELYNKLNAIKPNYIAVQSDLTLLVYSQAAKQFFDINLPDNTWQAISTPGIDATGYAIDYNPSSRTGYTFTKTRPGPNNSRLLVSTRYLSAPEIISVVPIPNDPIDIFRDNSILRTLVVSERAQLGDRQFSVYEVKTGAVDATIVTAPNNPELLLDVPKNLVQGTFKDFVAHGINDIFIFADEREVNGALTTYIQGINAAGKPLFTTRLGPDISNMVIDSSAGLLYVAERHSSPSAQIKVINYTDGSMQTFEFSGQTPSFGAISNLQLNGGNKLIYVGDTVSDSIFVIDILSRSIRELELKTPL